MRVLTGGWIRTALCAALLTFAGAARAQEGGLLNHIVDTASENGLMESTSSLSQGEDCLECCCPPCLAYVHWDTLLIARSDPERFTLATTGIAGPQALGTGQLDFDMSPVARLALGLNINELAFVEFSFMGLGEWKDRISVVSQNNALFTPYTRFGTDPQFAQPNNATSLQVNNARIVDLQVRCSEQNAEANTFVTLLCNPLFQSWGLFGFRYVRYEEHAVYTVTSQGGAPYNDVRVDNDMIGFQVGNQTRFNVAPGMYLEGWWKAGLFANYNDQTTRINVGGDPAIPGGSRFSSTSLAFVTDAMLLCTYDPLPWITLRAGYYVNYTDGIASAVENLDFIPPATGLRVANIDNNGTIFHHGPTVGTEIRW